MEGLVTVVGAGLAGSECDLQLVLAERMSIRAFGGIITSLILVPFAEPCGRRAVEPSVRR